MAQVIATHPLENQMFTRNPVGERVTGTAFTTDISVGGHEIITPEVHSDQTSRISALEAQLAELLKTGISQAKAATVTPVVSKAPDLTQDLTTDPNTVLTDPNAVLEATLKATQARLATAEAALEAAGKAPYVAPGGNA